MDPLRFDGRVAIITGAGGGLGRSYALALAARGARVVVNDIGATVDGAGRDEGVAAAVAREIADAGGSAVADTTDVGAAGSGDAIVRRAVDAFGRVDILVNNASVLERAPILELSDVALDRVLTTNLRGAFNLVRSAWSVMDGAGYGRIVNTSSATVLGVPVGLAYQATKAAMLSLSRSLAVAGRERGILVNAVLPTADTRMVAAVDDEAVQTMMRETFPLEPVAAAVTALVHESCTRTGEAFLVGGGRVATLVFGVTDEFVSRPAAAEDVAAHLADPRRGPITAVADRAQEFDLCLRALGVAR